ncbi:MAG: type II secretion system F family protein [Bryobacterales bacterium]|nr:type II secretion system F family protein [Bryobacterales bacterium]
MNGTGLLLLFFGVTLGSVFGVLWLFSTRRGQQPADDAVLSPATGSDDLLAGAFRAVGARVAASPKQTDPVRRLLQQAGYRYTDSVQIFAGIKMATGALLAAVLGFSAIVSGSDAASVVTAAAAGGGFGYLLPDRVLKIMIRRRMGRIRRAIPYALDLMVLSVEAGQSLNQALYDAASELREAYPDLSAELNQVHAELRAGKARADALLDLGERGSEPELRKLANVLIDADRFGTSLAPALRTHARYLRTRTRQQAQEAARKVGVKLVFPIFFLILPSVLLVTLAPAVMRMMSQLRQFVGE